MLPSLFGEEKRAELPRGKAEHCVFVWLGGGQGQIDTWDAKTKGDPKEKMPGE